MKTNAKPRRSNPGRNKNEMTRGTDIPFLEARMAAKLLGRTLAAVVAVRKTGRRLIKMIFSSESLS